MVPVPCSKRCSAACSGSWQNPRMEKRRAKCLMLECSESCASIGGVEQPAITKKCLVRYVGKPLGKEACRTLQRRSHRWWAQICAMLDVAVEHRSPWGQHIFLLFCECHVRLAKGFFIEIDHLKRLKLQDANFEDPHTHDVAKPDHILFG